MATDLRRRPLPSAAARVRERRVVIGGALVVLVALLLVRVVLPFAERWTVREARLDAARDRLSQLERMAADTSALAQAASVAERELSSSPRRVLHARSAALAASGLQALLQQATEGAGMLVNRVETDSEGATGAVSATLSAVGDIHGLSTLLATLERGPRVVRIDRLTVTQNSALRGAPDVLQVTVSVRAPVVLE